jgi:type VI secretion system secreted protein Hcp
MAYEFYVTIEGVKQGKFKPESMREKHKEKIAGISFHYNVKSPRDAASGQASGKRTHHPVTFVKEWGPATPQLFQALTTNESLKSVLFEFVKTDKNGEEYVYHTIKLVNASVSEIDQYLAGDSKQDQSHDVHELEKISFTFQRIELENKDGKTMSVDDWLAS